MSTPWNPNPPVEPTPEPAPEQPVRTRFADPVAPAARPTDPVSLSKPASEPQGQAPAQPEAGAAPEAEAQPAEPARPYEPRPVEPAPTAAPAAADADPVATPEALPPVVPSVASEQTPAPLGRGPLVPVLAALVAVLTALAAFLGVQVNNTAKADPTGDSRDAALQAARNAATVVFSYDYRHLAKDFAAGKALTTGQFAQEYAKTTAKLVTDVAPRYKAVVAAAVSDAAVVEASEDQVLTLVFVNQDSTSSLMAQHKVTQSRLEMTMVRKNGHWLVSKIKAL